MLRKFRTGGLAAAGLLSLWGCHSTPVETAENPFANQHPSRKLADRRRAVTPNAATSNHVADKQNARERVETANHEAFPPSSADALRGSRPVFDATSSNRLIALVAGEKAAVDFRIPEIFPGASAELLKVPPRDDKQSAADRRAAIAKLYDDLPEIRNPLGDGWQTAGPAMSLAELQQLALANSPRMTAAAAAIEAARGKVIQAGLGPNPTVGYQADTVGTGDTAGYHGVFAEQTIVTADKLCLAQLVLQQDVERAQIEYREAAVELATKVRRQYIEALMAEARVKFAVALAELFQQSYETQVKLVQIDEVPAFEPLQLRVSVLRSANDVTRAHNQYVGAWRQLAAVLNTPELTPRPLAGEYDILLPDLAYEPALSQLLQHHTQVAKANTQITRAQRDIQLQDAVPTPNVELGGAIFYDDTSPANTLAFNLQVGLPLPLRDDNRGNQLSAAAALMEARANAGIVQNDLTSQLADVHARFATNRELAVRYRNEILRDQVRTYRGLLNKFQVNREQSEFVELVVAQQQLAGSVSEYLNVLSDQWQAAVDLAEVLQTDDLFGMFSDPSISTDGLPDDTILQHPPTVAPNAESAPPPLPTR